MVVGPRAQPRDVAERPVGLQIPERVLAVRPPPAPVEMAEVRLARPDAEEPVPAGGTRLEIGRGAEPLVVVLLYVIVGRVGAQVEPPMRGGQLGGHVVALVVPGALHPVSR